MVMMRDYKIFTVDISYEYKIMGRDQYGEATGFTGEWGTERRTYNIVCRAEWQARETVLAKFDPIYGTYRNVEIKSIKKQPIEQFILEFTC